MEKVGFSGKEANIAGSNSSCALRLDALYHYGNVSKQNQVLHGTPLFLLPSIKDTPAALGLHNPVD